MPHTQIHPDPDDVYLPFLHEVCSIDDAINHSINRWINVAWGAIATQYQGATGEARFCFLLSDTFCTLGTYVDFHECFISIKIQDTVYNIDTYGDIRIEAIGWSDTSSYIVTIGSVLHRRVKQFVAISVMSTKTALLASFKVRHQKRWPIDTSWFRFPSALLVDEEWWFFTSIDLDGDPSGSRGVTFRADTPGWPWPEPILFSLWGAHLLCNLSVLRKGVEVSRVLISCTVYHSFGLRQILFWAVLVFVNYL